MKPIYKILASTFILIVLLSSVVQSVSAAAWIEHRFRLQLPDGKTKDLKGAKMHIFHKQHESDGQTAFTNTCFYPEKPPVNDGNEWAERVEESMDEDDESYHCATPSSCSIMDYGAPYLPIDFNDDRDIHEDGGIYEKGNASYKAFYGKTFSQALRDDAPFAYLADQYEKGNIRGFKGARWKGKVDFTAEDSKGPVAFASGSEINDLNNNEFWGANLPHMDSKQRWEEGEVFKDPQGGNVLHGRITWVLKAPEKSLEKPTGTLSGKCANNSPGVPSYSYTLSSIDLKGANFKSSHLHLNVTKGAWTEEFKREFGPPIYESTDANGVITYSLIFTTSGVTNNSLSWTVAPTEGIGNQASNTKTVADLVRWVDAKKAAGVTIPFEIKTNLESEKDGETILNDSISVASNGFKPKFVTNECGEEPATGGGLVCADIKLLDFGGNPAVPANLKPRDKVKFQCGQVTGATAYKFRVLELNTAGQVGKTVDLPPYPGRVSTDYSIPHTGSFMAQCAICTGPNGTACQAFADSGRNTGTPDPTPIPTPAGSLICNPPGQTPAGACVVPAGCNASLGWKVLPEYRCVDSAGATTSQVCCTL